MKKNHTREIIIENNNWELEYMEIKTEYIEITRDLFESIKNIAGKNKILSIYRIN